MNPSRITKRIKPGVAPDTGFSLPYALVIAIAIIASALAVTSRSTQGFFSGSFNQDARRAREAAEIGATRIISELNREHNRSLLGIATASGASTWGSAAPTGTINECATLFNRSPKEPVLPMVYSGGASSSSSSPTVVYISENGTTTTSSSATPLPTSTSRYAYRLNSIQNSPIPYWSGSSANSGLLKIVVNGYAYTGGRLSGSATIEQFVEILPKCCGLSLGANSNSALGNDLRNCNEATGSSFGFVFSTALTDDGSTVFNGADSQLGIVGGSGNVGTVACLGSATSQCPDEVRVGTADIPVNQVNKTLKPPLTLSRTPQPCTFTGGGTLSCNEIATKISNSLAVIDAPSLIASINAAAVTIPSNCALSTESGGVSTLSCSMTSLEITGGGGRAFRVLTSNLAKVKLFFPNEGSIINIGSGSDLQHCTKLSSSTNCNSTPATLNPLQRFQIYGCLQNSDPSFGCANSTTIDTSAPQTIQLRGNSSVAGEEPFFIYAPVASTTISGGGGASDQFSGVIWTNQFTGNGNVEVLVPGSGVGDLLDTFANNGGGGGGSPFVFEYIARAIRQFRILPGS